ncbi:MAG: hypothetical protein RJA70_4305 [Pseudomonadota bacterium]|jgi:ribosomal-protein-alanine N-acetyltransferase
MQNDLKPARLSVFVERPEDAPKVFELSRISGVCPDLESERQKEYCQIWVAAGPGVQGYLLCWWVADELQIVDLAVEPGARKRGTASVLLEEVLAAARSHGTATALLEVRASNTAALALYTKFGFQVARRRASYYVDGEDALEMSLKL